MTSTSPGRFEEIDVLRGFASICVVVSHYTSHCVKSFGHSPFQWQGEYAYFAVKMFFIISGFVIYFTIDKSKSWVDFAVSRATRLYPAYWAALTVMVATEVLIFNDKMWWGGYITNLTMFQEYLSFPNLDFVFWSLTVELAFYLVMGCLVATGLIKQIEFVAALWLMLACLWALFEKHIGIPLPGFLVRYLILPHVPFFIAGIMFYLIHTRGAAAKRVLLIFAALLSVGWMDGIKDMVVTSILFTTFALALRGYLSFLVSPVTLWLGTISYPLYLIHRNIGYSAMDWMHRNEVPVWALLIVTTAGALILGSLLTYWVERPTSRFLRQWYRVRKANTA